MLALVAALGALALAAVWAPWLRTPLLAADLALFVAFAVDALRAPSPARLGAQRDVPDHVGLGQPLVRRLVLSSPRARGLAVSVHEEASDGLVAEVAAPDAPDRGRFSREGRVELCRTYRPLRRGLEHLRDLRVRVTGPWGLAVRQVRLAGDGAVRVEPALLGLRQTLAFAASERWRDLGVRRVRRQGGRTEFESLREYVHGDDVRHVDWKAFARRGRPTVRDYQEERGQESILFVDAGRRMSVTTGVGDAYAWSKLDHALDAALQVAAVALEQGDRVGICAFGARVLAFVPPARGASQLARLKRAVFDLAPSERDSDLEGAFAEVAARHRRRATWMVLSDVADPLSVPHQRRALAVGARRNPVVFAALDDPALRSAAAREVEEPAAVRAGALELMEERRLGLVELARSGARVLDALPAHAAAPLLAAWLDLRRSGRT